jgi:hypothetical protein
MIAAQQIGVTLRDASASEQAESDHFGISLFSGTSARTASRATERRVIDRLSILTNAAIDQGVCEPFRAPSVSIGPHLERSNHAGTPQPAQSRSIKQARTSINERRRPSESAGSAHPIAGCSNLAVGISGFEERSLHVNANEVWLMIACYFESASG